MRLSRTERKEPRCSVHRTPLLVIADVGIEQKGVRDSAVAQDLHHGSRLGAPLEQEAGGSVAKVLEAYVRETGGPKSRREIGVQHAQPLGTTVPWRQNMVGWCEPQTPRRSLGLGTPSRMLQDEDNRPRQGNDALTCSRLDWLDGEGTPCSVHRRSNRRQRAAQIDVLPLKGAGLPSPKPSVDSENDGGLVAVSSHGDQKSACLWWRQPAWCSRRVARQG
jgi:hypothetical protein